MNPIYPTELFDQHFFMTLFDKMNDAVFVHPFKKDGFGNFIKVNKAACERLGYSEKELLSLTAIDVFMPLDDNDMVQKYQHFLQQGWSIFEGAYRTKKGELVPIEVNARLIKIHGVRLVVSVMRDISLRRNVQEKLKFSEFKYQLLFDRIGDPTFVHYFDEGNPSTFIEVNEAACYKFGYTKEEFLTLSPKDIVVPFRDFKEQMQHIYRILMAGQCHVFEILQKTKTGKTFLSEISVCLFTIGNRPAVMAIARDISDRKRAENQLQQQFDLEKIIATTSNRFSDVSDFDKKLTCTLQDLGLFTNADRATYYWYDATLQCARQTHWWYRDGKEGPDEMIVELHATDFPWWTQKLAEREMIGVVDLSLLPSEAHAEKELLRAQGIRSLLMVPIVTDDIIRGFMGVSFQKETGSWGEIEHRLLQTCGEIIGNALGRKLSEEYHRRLEMRLAQSQRVARVGHYDVDFVNDRWESSAMLDVLLGLDPDYEHTHAGWMRFVHPDFKEEVETYTRETVIGQAQPFDKEYKIINQRTHEECWVHDRGEVKVDDEGRTIGLFGTVQDITEYVKMREAMHEQEELMVAQSRHAAMGEMISMIAHQWRQPLGVIAMHANNILADIDLESLDSQIVKETMQAITKQTQHLSHTIDDFRDFFKPDKAMMQVSPKEIIEETLLVIGASLKGKGISVEVACPQDITLVTYSRELLQVMLNLLKNAKEALVESNEAQKNIWITVLDAGDFVIFRVLDNGGGIKQEVLPRIFDPYFSTKEAQNGTGLGLYMCKTIIYKHLKGTVIAYNKDHGACFEVTLPKELSCGGN